MPRTGYSTSLTSQNHLMAEHSALHGLSDPIHRPHLFTHLSVSAEHHTRARFAAEARFAQAAARVAHATTEGGATELGL